MAITGLLQEGDEEVVPLPEEGGDPQELEKNRRLKVSENFIMDS